MRIYLTGFMGAGKTVVGRRLAELRSYRFVDLDGEIEARAGMRVRAIFERHGEPYFRELEHRCLRDTREHPEAVVATGGGTIALPGNLELMRRLGVTVWVHPDFATIVSRIGARGKRDRPLFEDEEQAFELYRRRLGAYQQSDLTVRVKAQEGPSEVAGRIALLLRGSPCAT